MSKRNKNAVFISRFNNGIKLKANNKRITIFSPIKNEENQQPYQIENCTTIYFRALTSEVGKESAVHHALSENEKMKESSINLSDDALYLLYMGLHKHFENKMRNEIAAEKKQDKDNSRKINVELNHYYKNDGEKETTEKRLNQLITLGFEVVSVAEFGIRDLLSGLYIEEVWNKTDQEWDSYIDWVIEEKVKKENGK